MPQSLTGSPDVSNAELTLVEEERKKSYTVSLNNIKNKFLKISRKRLEDMQVVLELYQPPEVFPQVPQVYLNKFKETSDENVVFKKAGRPNMLDDHLIKKVKDIAMGTRAAGGVITRKQIINIAKVWRNFRINRSMGETRIKQIGME